MDTQHPAMKFGVDTDPEFNSQHTEGILDAESIRVPLFSHVEGNLWIGASPRQEVPDDFDYIINVWGHVPYGLKPHQTLLVHRLEDSAHQRLEREHLLAIASVVKKFMAVGQTLVHCQSGMNRSGLITALTLMLHGLGAKEAIEMLREKRGAQVLHNSHFAHWLQLEHQRMREGVVAR